MFLAPLVLETLKASFIMRITAMRFRRFLFGTVKRIMILRKIYLNRYKTMDILSLGWFGVLGMFTLSIAFVVWGRNGL